MELSLISAKDKEYWNSLAKAFQFCDAYFLSEYTSCFDGFSEGEAMALWFKDGNDSFFFPFRKRKINIPNFENYFDIASEYGYGGPLSNSSNPSFLSKAYSAMDEFFAKENIVAEFCRYHPLIKNAEIAAAHRNVSFCNKTVVIDTDKTFDESLMSLDIKKRSNYRRALKKGCSARVAGVDEVEVFHKIYSQTMGDVNASNFYFLSEDFFRRTLENVKNSFLIISELEGAPMAAGIFMRYGENMHYHFSGKNFKHELYSKSNGATVMLLEAVKIANESGVKKLHLGGGVGGKEDSLFKFKSEFSKDHADFFISKKIIMPEIYAALCEAKSVSANDESFFPAYRK